MGTPYIPDILPEYSVEVRTLLDKLQIVKEVPASSCSEYIQQLSQADVLVCPSNDDPMPLIVTEALMHSKLCICTDYIGSTTFLENEKEAIITLADLAQALSDAMCKTLENPGFLNQFAQPARQAYERHFSEEAFERKLLQKLKELEPKCFLNTLSNT